MNGIISRGDTREKGREKGGTRERRGRDDSTLRRVKGKGKTGRREKGGGERTEMKRKSTEGKG